MTELSCMPVYIFPAEWINISRCSILPGVKLIRLEGELNEKIKTSSRNLPIELGFLPNYVIQIDEKVYLEDLVKRISDDGSTPPNRILVESNSIAKQVIFSLVLTCRVSFKLRGVFHIKVEQRGRKKTYSSSGYSNSSLQELSNPMASAILQNSGNSAHSISKAIVNNASKLDRYYRSGLWWNDRLAMSLAYFWDAMCTPIAHQSFIGLTNALESLLSTTKQEITHILAERIALITEKTPENRKIMYEKVKELYKTRSKIVHGSVYMKKGRQTTESLMISPKYSIIPNSMMKEITDVTISVLISVLSNKEFLNIIQVKRNEGKIDVDINEYFTDKLFGV